MSIITPTTTISAPVIVASAEIWQVRGGPVCISTEAAPANINDGLMLADGEALRIEAGQQVRHWLASGSAAMIIRMLVL